MNTFKLAMFDPPSLLYLDLTFKLLLAVRSPQTEFPSPDAAIFPAAPIENKLFTLHTKLP